MNLFEFGGVEAEKAYAMSRYRRRRSFVNVLRGVEAAAAVALLGYWWLPTASVLLEIAGDWFLRIGAVLRSTLAVLVIVNLLIIWIVTLSREHAKNESDLYDQYISASASASVGGVSCGGGVVDPEPEERDQFQDKHIVPATLRTESVEGKAEANAVAEKPNQELSCEVVTAWTSDEMKRLTQLTRLNSKEFKEEMERFIMEKKKTIWKETSFSSRGSKKMTV